MLLGLIILGVIIFFVGWIALIIIGVLAVIGIIVALIKTFF